MGEGVDRRRFLQGVAATGLGAWVAPNLVAAPVGAVPTTVSRAAAPQLILGKTGRYRWWGETYFPVPAQGLTLGVDGHPFFGMNTAALRVGPGQYCVRYRLSTGHFPGQSNPVMRSPAIASVRVTAAGESRVDTVKGRFDHFEDFALGFVVSSESDLAIRFEPLDCGPARDGAFVDHVTLSQVSTSPAAGPPTCAPEYGGPTLHPNTPLDRDADRGVLLRRPDGGECELGYHGITAFEFDTPQPARFSPVWILDLDTGPYDLSYRLGGIGRSKFRRMSAEGEVAARVRVGAGPETRVHDVEMSAPWRTFRMPFTVASPAKTCIRLNVLRWPDSVLIDDVTLERSPRIA